MKSTFLLLAIFLSNAFITMAAMPCPFTRVLYHKTPEMQGDDVYILQNLIVRSNFVDPSLNASRVYDEATTKAVLLFQQGNDLKASGIFDERTANLLLELHISDGYKDDGTIPPGYLYKLHVPVHKDRTIQVNATLYDSTMTPIHTFIVRAHGQNDPNTGIAYNMFCGDGSTPTGLMTFDLNSPEDEWNSFGPYPVNRAVQGLKGNAAIVISDIRDGILLHCTPGEWPSWNINSNYSAPMINSEGCIHAHPPDILTVWELLLGLGVEMRLNTDGALPYPYIPQGILSVEQID